jgi:hypothetical protein
METNAYLGQYFTSAEMIVIKMLYGLLGSIGLIENVGVILIIVFKKVMLDVPSNWFVLSMAIADALTCLGSIVLVFIMDVKNSNIMTGVAFTFQFAMLSSTGNLSLLTFNRFLSVYASLRYPGIMPVSTAKRLVCLPWIAAGLILAVVGYSYQAGFYNQGTYITNSYYAVLIIAISAANIYMLKQARDKRKIDVRNAILRTKGKCLKKEYYLLIRLLIVNVTFFGSCIPLMTILYLYNTKQSRQTSSFRHKIIWFYVASVLNAAIDPLVYSLSHPIFKKYIKKFRNLFYSKPPQPERFEMQ